MKRCLRIVLAGWMTAMTVANAPAVEVEQWGRFETSVDNSRPYRDPFRDVTLEVTFTKPDGSTVDFWGFYDGTQNWRVRFMPDQLGEWRYASRFSDGSAGSSGTFECVEGELPGMISRDEVNPMWFGFSSGEPVLIRSLHVGDRFFAENWPDDKRARFLDWATEQGYNTLSIASHYLNRDEETRGRGWRTPDLWPLNVSEFLKLESMLNELAHRRIMVFPFAGFFGKRSDFPGERSEQTLYIRYVLARLGPYWNVMLNVAGPEPNLRRDVFLSPAEINRLGREIRSNDVFGHLLTVHNRAGDDPFQDSDWSTLSTVQGPKTLDRSRLYQRLIGTRNPVKPVFAHETLWSGNTAGHPNYSDEDLRKNAYTILMAGAALNFGDMEGNSSSGFSGSMELANRRQERHDIIKGVWDFFEEIPFRDLSPHPDLVVGGVCLAEPGRSFLVYRDAPGELTMRLGGNPFAGEWIDARNTSMRIPVAGLTGTVEMSTPDSGEDWLLWLTAEE